MDKRNLLSMQDVFLYLLTQQNIDAGLLMPVLKTRLRWWVDCTELSPRSGLTGTIERKIYPLPLHCLQAPIPHHDYAIRREMDPLSFIR